MSAAQLIAAPETALGQAAAARLADLAGRRAAGEPLSKIAGRREFWGLTLIVSPDVLDPRPETETLVEAALKLIGARRRGEPLRILDLGVGSGAILCALLTECPAARGLGVDASPAAVAIARRNLEACGLAERADVRLGSWTEGVKGPFDLIVSNPPYIRAPTSTVWRARCAISIRAWRSTAAPTGSTPIVRSCRPPSDCWRLAGA